MKTTNITIRMDKDLKSQAEILFKDLGLTMTSAFVIFAKQAVREQKIPFEITLHNNTIEAASDDRIKEISTKIMQENLIAYKELAKWFG